MGEGGPRAPRRGGPPPPGGTPRPEFLVRDGSPAGVETHLGGYTEAVDAFPWDASAYAVIVTRGHLADLESLRAVLAKTWRYAGLIGSRRKVRLVMDQVLSDGFDRAKVESVRAPIGLDIGAETPEELAVSIVGELVGRCLLYPSPSPRHRTSHRMPPSS